MTTENTTTTDDANTLALGPIVLRRGRFGLSVHLASDGREITHARTGDPLGDIWTTFKGAPGGETTLIEGKETKCLEDIKIYSFDW